MRFWRDDRPDPSPRTASDRVERRGVMAALEASHPLVWFDGEGRIVDANAALSLMVSRDLDELLTLDFAALTGIEDRKDSYLRTQWTRIATGQLTTEERAILRRDGTEIWSNLTYAAILNADGSTRRVLTIVIDLAPWSWRPKQDNLLVL